MNTHILETSYNQHYIRNDYQRLDLFELLAKKYAIQRALYPGCFMHITPAFVYPITSYVDTDKRAKRFFNHPNLQAFIDQRKTYSQATQIRFHAVDYRQPFEEEPCYFDLLISQYAGFVSQHCKQYLKIGGVLLVNNSHGDAGMAAIDADYQLCATVMRSRATHRITEKNLEAYFIPKKDISITKAYLEEKQRGLGYKKSASAYIFRRVN